MRANGAKYGASDSLAERRLDQLEHAALGFAGFLRLRRMQIVRAATGMGVQHEKCGILALQGVQAVNERHVLGDVGEIARRDRRAGSSCRDYRRSPD